MTIDQVPGEAHHQHLGSERILLTTREAAHSLGIGRTKLYELLDRPDGLPVVRIGRAVRIHIEDVRRFAEERRGTARGTRNRV